MGFEAKNRSELEAILDTTEYDYKEVSSKAVKTFL